MPMIPLGRTLLALELSLSIALPLASALSGGLGEQESVGQRPACAPHAAATQPVEEFVPEFRSPDMVFIAGGEFLMGSPISDETSMEYHPEERPQRLVRVSGFYLSRFPVTAEQFCQFLNAHGNHGYGNFGPRHTIELVGSRYRPAEHAERCPAEPNWLGAVAYCEWLAAKTGQPYRLATEAEWEYAARGPELRPWPWGDEPPPDRWKKSDRKRLAEPFYEQYGDAWIHHPYHPTRPHLRSPVGSFPRNRTGHGVYDMVGYRDGQWCSDRWELPEDSRTEREPMRVVRGASERRTNLSHVWPQRGSAERLYNLLGETSIQQEHMGHSWTRTGLYERSRGALVRLAMDGPIDDME